jgi:hypothetical protein
MEQSLHKNWKIPLNIDDFGISPTKYGDFPSRFFHGKSPTTKMDDNYIYIDKYTKNNGFFHGKSVHTK